jgi:hypothetical protein
MPRVKQSSILKIHSSRVKRMLNDRRFKRRMAMASRVRVDRSYDVPYVAGYSDDAKTVYIDRHLKTKMDSMDVERLIVTHELVEKALLDLFNITYQQAHHIATYVEHERVVKSGVNWRAYTKFLDPQMKLIGSEKVKKIPKDLDLEPYEEEKDFELLKRMMLHAR